MKAAFDVDDLKARMEAQGLPAIEGLAELVAKELFAWLEESCAIHENPFVKTLGAGAVGVLKPMAMAAIDKIDGVEG